MSPVPIMPELLGDLWTHPGYVGIFLGVGVLFVGFLLWLDHRERKKTTRVD